jgi:hypothetical protein
MTKVIGRLSWRPGDLAAPCVRNDRRESDYGEDEEKGAYGLDDA